MYAGLGENDGMATMDADETLRRFVVRARRVQAHSMVQDGDTLLQHSRGSLVYRVDGSGRAAITRDLPTDEEVFESLASRVRPLTVRSEPIYFAKVFDAIEHLIQNTSVHDDEQERVTDLRGAWLACEIQGTQAQAYYAQSASLDGSDASSMVSDTQLAAAWLYADLVHSDATGPKQEALAFSLRERYSAAVRLFSHLALLTVATLRLVESLRDAGVLILDDPAWTDAVTVKTSTLIDEVKVYVAPVGSPLPDMRDSLELSPEWRLLSLRESNDRYPADSVRAVLCGGEGEIIATHDAAITRRCIGTASAELDVLVAGSVKFECAFDVDSGRIVDARVRGWDVLDSTNDLKLASTRFVLQLCRTSVLRFEIGGNDLLSLVPPTFSTEQVRDLKIIADAVSDIVRIEHLTETIFGSCNGPFDDVDRVVLRRTRLMLEGHIVHAMRCPVEVTSRSGNPPQLVVVVSGTRNVGGAVVPTPQIVMRHSAMTATDIGPALGAGPEARIYRMEPPSGEQFLAWVPELVNVPNDEHLIATASWDLVGIDEASVSY